MGSLVSAAAPDLIWVIGARMFQGVGAAFFMGGALQVVVRLAPATEAGRVIGAFNAAWFGGVALGPLLGGLMATQGEGQFGYRLAFVVCALVCFSVALAARLLLPAIPSARRPEVSFPRSAPVRPGLRIWPPLVLSGIGQAVRGGLVLTMIPLLGTVHLGLSTAAVGVALSMLAVVDIAAMRVGGGLADRLGRRAVLVGALLSGAVVCIVAPAVSGVAPFVIWCAAFGVVVGVCWVVPAAVVVDVVEDQEVGLAYYRLSADVGQLLGSTVAGALVGAAGASSSLVGAGVSFVLLTAWVGRMPETARLSAPLSEPALVA
jgi:MFS family permease